MKWVGALLVLVSGYLCSVWLMRGPAEHLSFLTDGQFLFQMIESEMRSAGKPLPQLFFMLSERAESSWQTFFHEMGEQLQRGNDLELNAIFDAVLDNQFESELSAEERELFLQIGRGLFSGDLSFHRKNIQLVSDRLGTIIAEKRKELYNQKRLCRVCCLSVSALLVLLLL